MAVYNSFTYGSGQVYGTDDAIEYLIWSFEVYWDDAFVDESSRMFDLSVTRGRDHLLSTSGGWERFKPGECSALFDNSDGRFDPFNTSSPLYGFLLPGRVVRVSVDVTPSFSLPTQTFQVMRGIITDIQSFLRNGKRTARIIVKDGLEWLTRRSFTLGLTEDGEAMDIAGSIATGVNFGSVDDWTVSVLGADSVVLPFVWGRANNALSTINELCEAEMGQVVHFADGTLALICGDYTQAATTTIDEDYLLRDMEIRQPWEVVRTRAEIMVHPRTEGSAEIVWTFGVDDMGGAGEPVIGMWPADPSVSIDAIFSTSSGDEIPFTSPSVSDLYADGRLGFSGPFLDVSGSLDISMLDIGNGARLTFTKQAGIEDWNVLIFWIEVTVSPVYEGDDLTVTAENEAATVIYGEKTFELDSDFIQEQTYAQAYADYIVDELGTAHIFPTIQLEGRGLLQFGQELFTHKIALTIPTLGIDDTFRVAKIQHKWLKENGFSVRTTFRLEPVLTSWNGVETL